MTEEFILQVPREMIENCNGFAMDFGGSVLKLVYRNKDDWNELQRQDKNVKTAKLRLRSYSRPDFKDALELMKQHCYISGGNDTPMIYTTGIGCFEYSESINNTLNVKINNLAEFDCFAKAFIYMAGKLSRKELEYEYSDNLKAKVRAQEQNMIKMMSLWKSMSDDNKTKMTLGLVELPEQKEESSYDPDQPLATALPDLFPCMAAVLGSAFVYYTINADGSFQIMDGSNRGGRTFLGMGSLLVGHPSTYDELLALAVKGNNRNIDVCSRDFKRDQPASNDDDSEDEDDIYSTIVNNFADEIVFSFGKPASESEERYRTEDVIRAYLYNVVMDLVQNLHEAMILSNIKRCFLCGSFINHELVRELIAIEFQKRKVTLASLGTPQAIDKEVYFMEIGAYCSALGAFINYTDTSIGTTDKAKN